MITPGGNPICPRCERWYVIPGPCECLEFELPISMVEVTERWSKNPDGRKLSEALGISSERYKRWVVSPDDMRLEGEAFCADCPDHEACASAYPCEKVRDIELLHQARLQAEADARTTDSGSGE